ncbi:Gti1/Pac2 family-domain-containing protein [Hygrophoropsis aurantiaca]|uniref:Gti1/Pac2 family-domain-containing protein n=1 Tax=Hygrophoropsis aurantiaca TaxID=72124 RepID=A0ACB8A8A0_9AGAM|nr:Gti1/Pac2 family-domain-containing protein [Hygrophoropsis aurantiaca]
MQHPTCTMLRVRSPQDAQVIFHAVCLGALPMVKRRLDTEERRSISSGSVFVWEERGPNAEATGLGIERWTDGKRWGPSRVRDEFLFYHEKDPEPIDVELTSDSDTTCALQIFPSLQVTLLTWLRRMGSNPRPTRGSDRVRVSLVKQTYSVFVETSRGRRKWHLIAYFTHDTLDFLRTVSDLPELSRITVPPGKYRSARHHPTRPPRGPREDHPFYPLSPQYAPYPSPPRLLIQQSLTGSTIQPSHDPHGCSDPRTGNPQALAPLIYLQNLAPPRRHPLDEEALMSFYPGLA